MRNAVIVDMDGTLADVSSIRHHVRGERKDFDAFHEASIDVPPNAPVLDAVRSLHESGVDVLVVTARRAKHRHVTAWWLARHDVPSEALFMRGDKDGRPDFEVKTDILKQIRAAGWNVIHAFDDNPSVIKVWEDHGIPVTVIPGWEEHA